MSLLLIGGVATLGYWLNRNGRASRLGPSNITLASRDRPNGPNVYATDRVQEVNELVKTMANSRYPQPQSYGPNPFVAFEADKQVAPFISKLSGQPTDMSHGNMQPKFGAVKRQANGNVDIASSRKLEMYSVTGATNDPVKTEQLSAPLVPQNLGRLSADDAPDRDTRIMNDLSRRSDAQLAQIRQVRDIGDDIRIMPKNTDQLRAANNPMQAEYQNILTQGKLGDERPLQPAFTEPRHDYYSSGNTRAALPSASLGGPSQMNPQHLFNQDRHREGIKHTAFGPAVGQQRSRGDADRLAVAATASERPEPKREFYNALDPHGGKARILQGALGTTYEVAESKRDQQGTRIQAPTSSIRKEALIGIMDLPATSQDIIGNKAEYTLLNPQMPRSRMQQAKVNYDLPMTAREMNADNIHFGPGHTGLNLPATVQDHDLDANMREQLVQDRPHFGNATGLRQAHEQGQWTQDSGDREMGNRVAGGFAPLGQAVRTTTFDAQDEPDRNITRLGGGVNTTMGSGRKLSLEATLGEDVQEMSLMPNNRQFSKGTTQSSYPLITRSADSEAMNNRILLPQIDGTVAREMGRLRPIHE